MVRAAHLVVIVTCMVCAAVAAGAQQSRCADCHFANPPQGLWTPSGDANRHLRDWDNSAHARANGGWER